MSERTIKQAWLDAKPAIMAFLEGKRIRPRLASKDCDPSSWRSREEYQYPVFGNPDFSWEIEPEPPTKQYVDITYEQLFELCRTRELLIGPDGAKCFVWSTEEAVTPCAIKRVDRGVMWITLAELRKRYTYAATGLPVANEVESK